jgi:hypothetical protein
VPETCQSVARTAKGEQTEPRETVTIDRGSRETPKKGRLPASCIAERCAARRSAGKNSSLPRYVESVGGEINGRPSLSGYAPPQVRMRSVP